MQDLSEQFNSNSKNDIVEVSAELSLDITNWVGQRVMTLPSPITL